jgi:phospholipid/cholesterol/gamma-HCH transport system substrate-binding protein
MRRAGDENQRKQLIGIAVVALLALLLFVAFSGELPFLGGGGGMTVDARFASADEVDNSTPVRIGGVTVGHVVTLRPAPDHTTTVVMAITTGGVRLHADAGAQIRWRTLLGGSMYIALSPGSASAAALTGEIPLSRTGTQVDWDQFNDVLTTQARPQFRNELSGFASGLSGASAERPTLHVLGPSLQTVGESSEALRGQDIGDLTEVVRANAATLRALGSNTTALEQLVDGANTTLGVMAAHNVALAQTIELSPRALDATLTNDGSLDQTLDALDPLIVRLEPGARLLGPTDAVLEPLLRQAARTLSDTVPLLRVAPSALSALRYAAGEGIPLLAGLTPTIDRLNGQLIPFLSKTDPETRLKLYETIGPLASALSSSLSGFDANGFLYNFNVQVSTGSVILPCDTGPGGTSNLVQCIESDELLPSRRGRATR